VNFVQLNEAFDAWTKQCEESKANNAKDIKPWLQKPSVGTWLSYRSTADDAQKQNEPSMEPILVQQAQQQPVAQAPALVSAVAASPTKKCTSNAKEPSSSKTTAHAERHASPLASSNRMTSPRMARPSTAKNPPSPTKQPRLSAAVAPATNKSFDARRPSPAKEHPEVTGQKKAAPGLANKALLQRRPSPAKERTPITSTPASKDKADKPKSDSPKTAVAPKVASKPQTAAGGEQAATAASLGRSPSVGKGTSPRVHRPSQPAATNGLHGADKKASAGTTPAQVQQRSKSPPAAVQASVAAKKKQLSSAELEAQALEEKRQELRKLSEQNARRMARMSAVNTQVLKVSTPARSQTSSIARAPTPQSALAGLRKASAAMSKAAS